MHPCWAAARQPTRGEVGCVDGVGEALCLQAQPRVLGVRGAALAAQAAVCAGSGSGGGCGCGWECSAEGRGAGILRACRPPGSSTGGIVRPPSLPPLTAAAAGRQAGRHTPCQPHTCIPGAPRKLPLYNCTPGAVVSRFMPRPDPGCTSVAASWGLRGGGRGRRPGVWWSGSRGGSRGWIGSSATAAIWVPVASTATTSRVSC